MTEAEAKAAGYEGAKRDGRNKNNYSLRRYFVPAIAQLTNMTSRPLPCPTMWRIILPVRIRGF